MSFEKLGLSEALLKAVSKKGYTTPSPIQEKAIPKILEGRDVLASAQTGTGKTAGFTLPMLQILAKESPQRKRKIRALILTPTRELAAQVYDNVREYSEYLDLKSTVIFGGVNQNPQVRTIRQGVDILIATPGRLLDLENQRLLSLSDVEFLVLDEADRMLDMGFLRDIKKVLSLVPKQRQNLLFSATFSREIKNFARDLLHNPVLVEATPENTTAEKVDHMMYRVDKSKKTALTIQLIKEGDWDQVLIFTRTKHGANRLSQKLDKAGISSSAIHGNKTQNARTKALSGFKKGSIRVLVATDIAARGLDIPLLPHVINYELPNVPEDYVHRIGRTGRAGASGEAISLVGLDEKDYVRGIERLLDMKIPKETVDGFEPTDTLASLEEAKKQQGSGRPDRRGGRSASRPKSNSGRGGNENRGHNKSKSGGNRRRNG
ncbi:DEAD/DEAH box helicase [Dokdonia sinensis]|uniref:DEAD-box ATP-dependent RNA helicase RhpA n=1 Tax=Dokdonia sinensis TaxID=2479847 RepID=A0A3M0G3C0_9FLAO|nr:DEAD/DEAH box helicase [Dokdonia sinensis]RMB59480.1 DEAD/DEAH box helicase [Dokdonia sinensis]